MKLELSVFGERLRLLRKEQKLTQRQMGDLLCITERNYQSQEYGKTNVTATTMMILVDYFHVSVHYLLGRTDNREINR